MKQIEVSAQELLKAEGEVGLREVQTSMVMEAFDELVLKRRDYVSIRQVERYTDVWNAGVHYFLSTTKGLVPFASNSTHHKARVHRKNKPDMVHTTITTRTQKGGEYKDVEVLMQDIERGVDAFFSDYELSMRVQDRFFEKG